DHNAERVAMVRAAGICELEMR
ncbi:MAG: hypothetical protein QOI46_1958, partial [Alphaproteobacteria bacterium]|nr:hypothetical protein [Alphaproteobacteria bacterium]